MKPSPGDGVTAGMVLVARWGLGGTTLSDSLSSVT